MVGLKYTRENNQNNDLAIYHDFNFLCELSPIGFWDIFKQCDLQRDVSNPKSLVTLSLLFSCQVFSEEEKRSETTSRKVDRTPFSMAYHCIVIIIINFLFKKVTKHFLEEKSFLFFAVWLHYYLALASSTSSGKFSRQ